MSDQSEAKHEHHEHAHTHETHEHSTGKLRVKRDWTPLYTPISILIAGILIAIGLFLGLSHGAAGSNVAVNGNGTAATATVDIKNVKTDGEPFIGSASAPVTLAYWSDYQCPFCKQFETTSFATIVKDYVDTGKVKVVFKDFQFLGPNSTQDGEWARAVWNLYPSLFFSWRTQMFSTQPEENSLTPAQNLARLENLTAGISGIKVSSIEANVAKNKSTYDAQMAADQQEGESFGIQGTPGFITGTQMISGAEPLATFTSALDAQLK